jgi:5'-methylthioadenosine phosphorylase
MENRDAVQLGVIGGSQAYWLLESGRLRGTRLTPKRTPCGISQPIFQIEGGGRRVLFLSRHGEKHYSITAPFVNYRANIYALKDLGVTHILAWTGPGAIHARFCAGDFVIVSDILDETRRRASTFFEDKGYGFIRMDEPFCPSLRKVLKSVLEGVGARFFDHGVYVCTEGPRLETPAEIRKFKRLGAELIGMTLAPEAFLARELQICYAALGYVTNCAEGVKKRAYAPGQLFEGLATKGEMRAVERAVLKFPAIIESLAGKLGKLPETCHCQHSMKRYTDAGVLPSDWHKWLSS